jgi:hypothetical protein
MEGEVVGDDESLRIAGWLDEARALSGIVFDGKME